MPRAFLCSLAVAAVGSVAIARASASSELEAGKLFTGVLAPDAPQFVVQSANADIRLTNHVKLRYRPREAGQFTVTAHSDASELVMAVLQNGQVLPPAAPKLSRRSSLSLEFSAKEGDLIEVVIGARGEVNPVPYSVSVGSAHASPAVPIAPQALPVNIGVNHIDKGLDRGTPFQFRPARWLAVPVPTESDDWFSVKVVSADFDPLLVLLDSRNQVVAVQDDVSNVDRSAVHSFKVKDAPAYFVVVAANGLDGKDLGALKYDVEVTKSVFDPSRPVTSRIEYFLGGAIGAFLVGLITSAAMSYYFYHRSIRTKELHWELVSDDVFIDEAATNESVNIVVNGIEVKEASRLRVCLTAKGPHQISSTLVASPLTLEVRNAISILAVSNRCNESSGWRASVVPGAPKVRLDFERLNPNDAIQLDVIYVQDAGHLTTPADVVLTGSIAEVSIYKDHNRPVTVASRVATIAINLIFMILAPLAFLDIQFRFMPEWWAEFWVKYAPWFMAVVVFYLFATAEGRRTLTQMARYLGSVFFFWRDNRRR